MTAVRILGVPFLLLLLATGCALEDARNRTASAPGVAAGSYDDLVTLHAEVEELLDEGDFDGDPDHAARRIEALETLRARLFTLAPDAWPVDRRVDWLLVRSRLDSALFLHRVLRPWARDPGFYVDRLMRPTFVELPLDEAGTEALLERLADVPAALDRARGRLTDPAADYVSLALRNLDQADGVGHGHPYRAVPPPGVRGWYADLRARAERVQPELLDAIDAASASIDRFRDWLRESASEWTAPAGVGRANFDWYLRQVKFLPYDAEGMVALAELEYRRLHSALVLERLRNAALPELEPAASAEEYARRIREADEHVRRFIREQRILTVPDSIGELDTNVPWIVRPGGPNFWEAIQFRDPRPDHVHAVIPGHRFDAIVARTSGHPIRAALAEGARVEGWAYYLEEMFLDRGFLADLPRTRELFYIFGLKRAVRVPAEVGMHLNRVSVPEAVEYMTERVPHLDDEVARVDAEIYLRRPPGYGSGYLVGGLEVRKLLSDRARQLAEDFDLGAFHDAFLAAGRIPVSLIRWEMTGLDDEVREFQEWVPIPEPGGR